MNKSDNASSTSYNSFSYTNWSMRRWCLIFVGLGSLCERSVYSACSIIFDGIGEVVFGVSNCADELIFELRKDFIVVFSSSWMNSTDDLC